MTTNPYIYPVPVGATIPAGTEYAAVIDERNSAVVQRATDIPRFTADPIPAPRPAPPTEPGTVLLDVKTGISADGRKWDSAHCIDDEEPRWRLIAGEESRWAFDWELASWTVADVVPRKADPAPDPLDENDHRDRIDSDGDRWTRRETAGWMDGHWSIETPYGARTLRSIENDFGPLRFADEADQS